MEIFLLALGVTCMNFAMLSVFKDDEDDAIIFLMLMIIFMSCCVIGFLSAGGI